jgi:uncharacterized repeat protein (TIGR03843 family)
MAFDLEPDQLLDLFTAGDMEVEGRMPNSSNATLLVTISDDDRSHRAVYKPGQGERPLWDFPPNIYTREAAMYRLAAALGWSVIPPTTLADGPFGEGSVQAFVDADFEHHYFSLHEEGIGDDDLRKICVLDIMANNTDRKSGHCLLGRDGRIYGIDNGLSFHREFKLRTVLWDYCHDPLPPDVVEALTGFVDRGLPDDLAELLNPFERDALLERTKALLSAGVYPDDETGGHRWPWPLI